MIYYIYKIYCEDCDYVYIGSTRAFTRRKNKHKSVCNNENDKAYNHKLYQTIRDNGGWSNWKMFCIDEIDVENRRQAEMKEEKWRVELNANLNMVKAYRTEEEKKEQMKAYSENNKDKITEYKKEYYEKNRDKIAENKKDYSKDYYKQNSDKIAERHKQHYKQNKEQILEQRKEYKQQNKDKILEYQKEYYEQNRDKINEKIICECGCEISKSCLAKHKKTKKHQAWEWRQTAIYTKENNE